MLSGVDNPWFCSVNTGKAVNAVAMRTPPHMVIMAHFSGDIKTIAEKLETVVAKNFKVIPGVVGDKELADVFARRWSEKFGVEISDAMAQRIYRLDKVNDIPLSPGRFRVAGGE
jgi:hypothetical protein